MNLQTNHYRMLLFFLGVLLFLPFLGAAPLFDWDEINFAESAREMLVSGDYARVRINFQPFWEKPPLFFWMQAGCMHIFGVNEFAARLPNAIFGIITLLTLFEFGRELRSDRYGFLWALCMLGSFLPHVYFKSGIIDPVFNYFIFLSVWFIAKTVRAFKDGASNLHPIFAGIFIGLAVLTKGPVGLLLPLLTVFFFWMSSRFKAIVAFKHLIYCAIAATLVTSIWFIPETIKNGPWFLEEFIEYQIRLFRTPDAGHAQPFFYHFVVVLLGCFPMSVPALRALFRYPQARLEDPDFLFWMKTLFWVVMILFSVVTTKIVHYSSMAYLPMSAIAAVSMEEYLRGRQTWNFWQVSGLFLVGSIIGLAMIGIPLVGMHPDWVLPLLKDPFAAENLQAAVSWNWMDLLPGFIWLLGISVAAMHFFRQRRLQAITWLFVPVILSTSIFLMSFPKRIAGYTQQAPLDFYASLQGRDVYVETLHFKSFAQYFYFRKPGFSAQEAQHCLDTEGYYHIDALRSWYLSGNIDKPVYFVLKSNRKIEYEAYPDLVWLKDKNGFSFAMRPVPGKGKQE
jgi:4-amino-4-deoxy-L-arabinose transferase-like glycosyltransferase